jgi:hypothetical protein
MEPSEAGEGGGDPQAHSSDPKVKWHRPRLLLPDRASDLEATALCELGPSSRRRDRSEDCSAFSSKRRISSYARVTKESGLTESADRSIAREGHTAVALGHGIGPPRRP